MLSTQRFFNQNSFDEGFPCDNLELGKRYNPRLKPQENTLTNNRRLKIGSLTKMDNYFTICQYKTEEPRNIEIFASASRIYFGMNKPVFPRSKMTVFQTYNKKYWIKNVAI